MRVYFMGLASAYVHSTISRADAMPGGFKRVVTPAASDEMICLRKHNQWRQVRVDDLPKELRIPQSRNHEWAENSQSLRHN